MKKIMIVTLSTIGLTIASSAFSLTCKESNLGYPFRQVVMAEHEELRCDYGKDFDFDHSYNLKGNYVAVSGPWSGSSDPSVIYCRSDYASCVFALEAK